MTLASLRSAFRLSRVVRKRLASGLAACTLDVRFARRGDYLRTGDLLGRECAKLRVQGESLAHDTREAE